MDSKPGQIHKLSPSRPSPELYFIQMASLVSTRATCKRRRVGCVLVDKRNHVIATGYNGVAAGAEHCIDVPCPGASYRSGEGLDKCEAIHAEQNALLQCKDVYQIAACYTTSSPCMHCIKLLLNTSCFFIYFLEEYDPEPLKLWKKSGRMYLRV